MNSLNKILCTAISSLCLTGLYGCSSIAEYQSSLPYIEFRRATDDISDRKAPAVQVPYCLINKLDENIKISKLMISLFVNDVEIETREINYDDKISAGGKECSSVTFKPDVIHNPMASSTLLNTMLDRDYRVEGTVIFNDDEALPVTTTDKGKL